MIDSNNNVVWQSQRQYHLLGIFQYIFYFILGIFMCWFCWFVLLRESLWYALLALVLSMFYCFEIYKALNFKSMFLDNNGLSIQTRFSGNVFYPYGSFGICNSLAIGIRFFERIEIYNANYRSRIFLFPCGYDSLGSFKNNQAFKELCTKYTQQALKSMNLQEKANLYKIYQDNIEYIFNETRNHNVFTIDFSPYKESLKKLFAKEIQETLSHLSIQEQAKIYQSYQKACRHKSGLSLEYDLSYFSPYKAEIESYLKDKNE